ncbi:hypothetical protein F66182_445 [Fusarium sp. NRRL 66182]|nr:hypothetical protein F66182_445 [Fusarium sp. NRRL 66182]
MVNLVDQVVPPPPYDASPIELSQPQSEGRPIKVIYCPSRRMSLAKLRLRVCAVLNTIVVMGLAIGVARDQSLPVIWFGVVCGAGLLWNIADIRCYFSRHGKRSAHPGASVAFDLLLWMPLLSMSCVQSQIVMYGLEEEGSQFLSLWIANTAFGFIQL